MSSHETISERFKPPLPAKDAARLPKRERLELLKPILRQHQDEHPGTVGDRDPLRDSRWSWLYEALGETGHGRGLLDQARAEIKREDAHGHYRERACSTIRLIEDGWNRYEAEIDYWRGIRRSEDHYTHGHIKRFHTRRAAERWTARKIREYDRYILRLIREGVYDERSYEK